MKESDNELKRLLKDFYSLIGIKIAIYDSGGEELCFYPDRYSPYCAYLRSFPYFEKRCRECDRAALAECKRTGREHIYTCHAGLTECMSPVVVGGNIRGFIVTGQIKENDGENTAADYSPLTEGQRLHADELYRALPVVPREKTAAALHVLEACAGWDYLKEYVREREETLGDRMEAYVRAHVSDSLDVNALCRAFGLSRRELYEWMRDVYDCTPAEFVRLRRLGYAAELLRSTSMPVHKVAEACGIGDYNYFSKIFRKRFGISARQYKNAEIE